MAVRPERNEAVRIAVVAYDAIAAWKRLQGEKDIPGFAEQPAPARAMLLRNVELLMANPGVGAAHLHRHWMGQMLADGWSWGERYNAVARTDPHFKDWRLLDDAAQRETLLLVAVVQALTDST
jgi:hypothetical protein